MMCEIDPLRRIARQTPCAPLKLRHSRAFFLHAYLVQTHEMLQPIIMVGYERIALSTNRCPDQISSWKRICDSRAGNPVPWLRYSSTTCVILL